MPFAIELPEPSSDQERAQGRNLGRYLNPTRRPDTSRPVDWPAGPPEYAPELPADHPLLVAVLNLSAALSNGAAATIVVPLDVDDDTRPMIEFIAHHTAAVNHGLDENTGTEAAVMDLYYAAGAALAGVPRDRFRALELFEDALWWVANLCNTHGSDDMPMLESYRAAALGTPNRFGDAPDLRADLERRVRDLARVTDVLERVIAAEDTRSRPKLTDAAVQATAAATANVAFLSSE